MAYQIILQDLQFEILVNPSIILPFYTDTDNYLDKIRNLKRQYRRAKSLNNRKEMLYVLWYIGEIIETQVDERERGLCIRELTDHYYKLIKRVYYLYEVIGLDQIGRTQRTTVTKIAKLSQNEHQQLVQQALVLAGARMQEEEVVRVGTVAQ